MDWSILIGFAGGLLVSIVTLVGTLITKRAENKQAYRLSVLENAYKDYELRVNLLEQYRKEGKDVVIYPWDMYVLSYNKILDLAEKKNIKESEIKKLLSDISMIQNVYDNQGKERSLNING